MVEAEQGALIESARFTVDDGLSAARALASSVDADERFEFARAVVHGCLRAYWSEVGSKLHCRWPLRVLPDGVEIAPIPEEAGTLAQCIGAAAAHLDPLEAGYLVGVLYTTMMPRAARAKLGAYYTPPALCERLLDMATGRWRELGLGAGARSSLWRRGFPRAGCAADGGGSQRAGCSCRAEGH